MNFWKETKRGIQLFLAGLVFASGLASAMPINSKPEDVLGYVESIPKQDTTIDHNNLDFLIREKHDLDDITWNNDNTYNAYIGPATSFGKNILRESIDWQGKEISDKLTVYCDKGLEEILNAVSGIAKEAVDEYEEIYGHKLKKDVGIYVLNSYRFGGTNLVYIGVPRSLGGFFQFYKWNIVMPWRDNDFVRQVVRHELAHVYLCERIYEEYLKSWKILYNKELSPKPLVLPLWIMEGDAERRSRGQTKRCKEIISDLVRNNAMEDVDKFPEGSYVMYKGAHDFFLYLDEKYGKEKPDPLWDNYYDIFKDVDKTFETEDIFDNTVKKEKVKVNPLLGPLYKGETIVNYSFKKTYGQDLGELVSDWQKDRGELYFKEQEVFDELEDVATRVCPEQFALFPVLNGNTFAYIARNKHKTGFEIKIVKDKCDEAKDEKGKYEIKKISEGTRDITRIKVLEGSRMDINKDYLIWSAMVGDNDKLFFHNLKTGKLESKKFEEIIEINDPTISFDGKYVAFCGISKKNGYSNVYVYNRESGGLEMLTDDIYFEEDLDFDDDSYDLVGAYDKTKNRKNNDIFKIKNLDKNNIERIICNDAGDHGPRFGPEGSILFISDRNGKDNVFLLNPEDNTVHQVTNLITPVKDVFWTENKKGKDKILITYFDKLSYNIAKLEKADIVEVAKEKIQEGGIWEYEKCDLKDKKFKRRWGWFPENLAYGMNSNGLYIATHFSDGTREKHILPGFFLDFNKVKNSDVFLRYGDFSNKIPYMVGIDRFVYVHPEKYGDVDRDSIIDYPYPDEVMDVIKGDVSFNYPINLNERLSNSFSLIYSSHDSKDFFGETWQKYHIYEELYPEIQKGLRVKNIISFTSDYTDRDYKGPIEGNCFKINLRTNINPGGLEKITSVAVDAALKKYKKLGGFGVIGLHAAAGYGEGEEFEQFGIGDVRTIGGYGKGGLGLISELFGNGYYLFNAEISHIPLIKAIVPFWNTAHHGLDGSLHLDMGNVFNNLDEISKPKISIGVGLTTYFLMAPLKWRISFPFEKDGKPVTQFYIGYNF